MTGYKINIIGRGNVASHLYKAFEKENHPIIVNPHTLEGVDINADYTLIAVADSAILSVLKSLPKVNGIVAHTSGSTDLSVFQKAKWCENYFPTNCGVFYPLQTFSKEKDLIYSEIPFFIEAYSSECERRLIELASTISDKVYPCDSDKRKHLHIASVFSCNFVNHLWALSYRYLKENELDFSMLQPLIKETLQKAMNGDPAEKQTGPASRGDLNIVKSHLDALSDYPDMKNIYNTLSDSIMNRDKD